MKLLNLASGSKANCTYIESSKDSTKILIDLGLSFNMLQERLSLIKVKPEEITAVFITHEHIDHIKGISTFIKKCPNSKIYIHAKNFKNVLEKSKLDTLPITEAQKFFRPLHECIELNSLRITCFNVSHDSYDCVGYTVEECGNVNKIGIATDLGFASELVINHLKNCKFILLEANHDVNKLISNPNYPMKTKTRILSNCGHLNNNQCAELIYMLYKFNNLKQVILGHLSENNNTPLLAYTTIVDYLKCNNIVEGKDIYIDVAYQNKVGTFFLVE